MAVANKTHTLTFFPKTEVPDATTKIVPIPTEGASFDVEGQLTPLTSEQAFTATGLELTNAYLFFCDVEDGETITVNSRVEDADGNNYAVLGKPKPWTAIEANSFAEVYLELLETEG